MFPALIVAASVPCALTASSGVAVLFQNDGNWTSHAEKPSALLAHDYASYDEADEACASYGETLLDCDQVSEFQDQLNYQAYLGNVADDDLLWTSCEDTPLVSLTGESVSAGDAAVPHRFLCTNGAPLVSKVDTDYSVYPRVNTSANGTTFTGLRDHMAFRFLGIPFAQPPVDSLRFKVAEPWTGSYVNATKYSAACIQNGWFDGNKHGLNPWGNSEDCLYLNVYTPEIPDADVNATTPLKPVMFWLHGGGQVTGTAVDSTFDGASLASRSDVVVVTTNYRLNIFGYLSLNDDAVPGNFATSDKIEALKWVKKYISGFGGNPNNITIFGQSAGGGSVIDLVTSPKAERLFDGAITMSGGRGWAGTQEDAADQATPYIQPHCNSTRVERLECLQKLPTDTLLNITTQLSTWRTVIDGNYTLDIPIAQVAKGRQAINSVKFMLGFMPEEGQSLMETAVAPNETSFPDALDAIVAGSSGPGSMKDSILTSGLWLIGNETVSNGSTVYADVYNASVDVVSDLILTCYGSQFASVGAATNAFESMHVYILERAYAMSYYNWYDLCTFPVGEPDTPYYRCHSGDLYEIFGTYYLFDQPVRVAEDIYFTNAAQDMWGSFARTGNPNVNKDYLEARGYNSTIDFFSDWTWPEFNISSPQVASVQYPESSITTLPEQKHCSFLNPLLFS